MSVSELVLLGDEAIALGAIHAGITAAYAYPGTPSTEITEYILEYSKEHGAPFASWASNEKTAYEQALGVSFVGRRALVCMKHVGLNVAADPFVNSALLEINGGLVLVVADDPGMHSSQNEQDSRFYADFAGIPCLEPVNQQEAYHMVREAFDLSEEYHVPVMIRITTRLAHSRAVITPTVPRSENKLAKAEDTSKWMLLPALARKQFKNLLEKQTVLKKFSEETKYNTLEINPEFSEFGVITTGLGRNYYVENIDELKPVPSHLHISAYPIPVDKVRTLAEKVEKIIVLEEGYPFVEKYLRGILSTDKAIEGKMDSSLPPTGELNPDCIRAVLGLETRRACGEVTEPLPGRPPQLCRGCPHSDTFELINRAREGYENSVVTSDIGCYALGALPPYKSIETIVCMGASIGVAKGAAEAGFSPVVATIGDSTFLHSGTTHLVDAVANNTPMTIVIMDNSTVAMTGGQETMLESSAIQRLVEGIGVEKEHLRIIEPLKKHAEKNLEIIKQEMDYPGVSVIISIRECLETAKKRKKSGGAA
jgi:indolepyruvate ferredoxin oxidoreductase alpha subunit